MRRLVIGAACAGLAVVLAVVVLFPLLLVSSIFPAANTARSCLGVAAVTVDTPQPVADPDAPVDASVASWNAYGKKNTTAAIVAGIRAISRSAGVIGLQEMNPDGRRDAVARAIEGFGWEMSTGSNAVPIVWDTSRYQAVAQKSQEVFGVRRIEPGVAGRSIGPKSQQWVQLQDRRTGGQFFVLNFHLIPSIEKHRRPVKNKPVRLRLAGTQVAAAVAQANVLKGSAPVVLTGDHNMADPAAWLRTRLNPDGYYSTYQLLGQPPLATHGSRRIDYVWSTAATLAPVRHQVLGSAAARFAKSDHRPIVATLSSRRPSSAAEPAPTSDGPAGTDQTLTTLGGCLPCPGAAPADLGVPGSTKTGDWDKMGARDPDGKPPITGVLEPTVRKAAEIVNYATASGVKIDTVYGAPPSPSMWGTGEHGMGRAIDVMVGSIRDGDIVADYTWRNRDRLRVKWIVWNRRIRSQERNNGGWRPYSGTDNPHTDHPHIFFDEGPYLPPADGSRQAASMTSVASEGDPGGWADPIAGGVLGARFGATGSWSRYHTGDDYRAGYGTKIRSVAAGQVVFAGNIGNWAGNHVAVRHPDGWTTMYSHMSQILVRNGQTVSTGTILGLVGATGRAFGAHLHFETYPPGVRYGDVYNATDPQKYMAKLKRHGGQVGAGEPAPRPIAGGTFGTVRLNAAQVERAAQALATADKVGRQLGWDEPTRRKAAVVALITPMQESTMGENPGSRRRDGNGDGGFNAQRSLPGWYGTLEQTQDPVYATRVFLLGHDVTETVPGGAGPKGYHIPGLNDIRGWESMAPTRAAQAVQRSAYPDYYAKWVPMANDLITQLGLQGAGTADQSSCGADPIPLAMAVGGR